MKTTPFERICAMTLAAVLGLSLLPAGALADEQSDSLKNAIGIGADALLESARDQRGADAKTTPAPSGPASAPDPAAQAAGPAETITVATPHDLAALAANCTLDAWSRNKTVQLTADLDLTAVDFQPIPVFCGVFDGGGHTIKGLRLTGKGSRLGLFRAVGAGGVVQDLTVRGTAAPTGSRSSLGLLCGENNGTLLNCTVSGSVTGGEDVGGLVGVNNGTVASCRADAAVTGTARVGGVAGSSTGTLTACVNAGGVNTGVPDETLTDPVMNVGGVVGRTTGTVEYCSNRGSVGYAHSAYNVGGIAGLHSGSLAGCENTGLVQGRKDVGGVAGRFLPQADLIYGQDPVEALNSATAALTGLLTTLSGQLSTTAADAAGDVREITDRVREITDSMSQVKDAAGGVKDSANTGLEQGSDDADAALDTVYAAAQDINDTMDGLSGEFSDLTDDADAGVEKLTGRLDDLREAVASALDTLGDAGDQAVADARKYGGYVERDVDEVRAAGGELSTAMDETSTQLGIILTAASAMGTDASALIGAVVKYAATKDPTALAPLPQLTDDLSRQAEKLDAAGTALDASLKRGGAAIKRMGTGAGALADDLSALGDALGKVYDRYGGDLRDDADSADRAGAGVTEAVNDLKDAFTGFSDGANGRLATVNDRMNEIEDALKIWKDKAKTLGDGTRTDIDGHLDDAEAALGDVNDKFTAISDKVGQMSDAAGSINTDITATMNSIIDQLDAVRLAANGLTKTPEWTVEDQSEEESANGRILSAQNAAKVEGDANVGGVVGIVSIQTSDDPEDELDFQDDKLLADATAVIRASVRGSSNSGDVTAKNESAGGIVGRGDMGAVVECVNTGDVTVTGGANCGGVVGLSSAVIRRSSALCKLTGGDSVGGVVGSGKDVTDCRTMVEVDSDGGEKLGAIAGSADGEVSGNYFVREELGGLDGVDYAGRAEGLTYEAFSALENLPELFLHFAVTFVADGRTVASVPFPYGGRLSAADIPAVPAKDGNYAAWETFSTAGLRRSLRVEAVYTPWATTISSGGARPVLLALGSFSPKAAIDLRDAAPDRERDAGAAGCWNYAVTDPERAVADTVQLRLLAGEGKNVRAALMAADGTLAEVEAVRDGSYLVFDAPSQGTVALLNGGAPAWLLPAGLGAAAAVLALLLLLLRRRKKKNKSRAERQETAKV